MSRKTVQEEMGIYIPENEHIETNKENIHKLHGNFERCFKHHHEHHHHHHHHPVLLLI